MGPVTVSIVSHGHGDLLPDLLEDLEACPEVGQVIVTRNIPETTPIAGRAGWLSIIDNTVPKGFGANHNAAFKAVQTRLFAVLNPDIRLDGNPFPVLMDAIETEDIALCAPAVVNPAGDVEDSARRFPTFMNLAMKALGGDDGRIRYRLGDPPVSVPWVAGMFMLWRSSNYAALGGFDEGFFLYYEDVDICARLADDGHAIMLCPEIQVVHDARRASRHDKKHMFWHASSMARYFRKHFARSLG